MEEIKTSTIRLTQYSHGAGCGCKIAPAVLESILHSQIKFPDKHLLVGNETKDDAAAYDLGNGQVLISTTDFFTPIVDDAFDFGRIAAANAISDVYAMGGRPVLALAVLGFPVERLPAEIAQRILEGAHTVCGQAGIALAGGHSIDSPEPIFGLAVTGLAAKSNLKKNSTATENCKLFLTKPLGAGIVTTAHKRALAQEKDFEEAVRWMTTLNSAGEAFGKLEYVRAMTDVTGFGLLGHLIEMCEGSCISAEINYEDVPLLPNLKYYLSKMIYPDSTFRNWKACESKTKGINEESIFTLCDPQTNGGLLVAVDDRQEAEFKHEVEKLGTAVSCIGNTTALQEKAVIIH